MTSKTRFAARFYLVLNLASAGCVVSCLAGEGKQLGSLPRCESPRFELTERVWPAEVHKPHVCLWKDDALAAVSITVDDNTATIMIGGSSRGESTAFASPGL